MAFRRSMSALRLRCLQRVNMATAGTQTDRSVDAAEVNDAMDEVYGEHVFETVADVGDRYFETSFTYTTSGSNALTEQADLLSYVDTIERVYDTTSGKVHRLRKIEPAERSYWKGRTGHAQAWEPVDASILLYPTPPVGDQYILRYVPQAPDLTTYADGDLVDVVCRAGLSALTWGVAVLLLAKSRSDVTLALQERDNAVARLNKWACDRLQNMPHQQMVESDSDPPLDGSYYYDR